MRSISRDFQSGSPAPGGNDDAALLASIHHGDERALAQIYDRYSKLVYSVALRVLRDASAAEDVLQEVFIQVWRTPEKFLSHRGSMGAWLTVVARNRSIDLIRRRKSVSSVEAVALVSPVNLAEEMQRTWVADKARGVIQTLSIEQRKAVEMAFYDGLSHIEIAEMAGEPSSAIKTRIRTALLTLRKAMQA